MTEPLFHVLVLVHGITPEEKPLPSQQYAPFLAALATAGVELDAIVPVEWGVSGASEAARRPDQFLAAAEANLGRRVRYDVVRRDESPSNEVRDGFFEGDRGVPIVRGLALRLREQLVQFGLADAVYYSSPEGERAVRDAVYRQVLGALERAEDREVRLHVVAHSLGVTVSHDLLFALFDRGPRDFPEQTHDDVAAALFRKWRERAQAGRVRLGTLITYASQLPLFLLRKQALVELFARDERLDPAVIGIDRDATGTQWANFYDVDDVLAFATRRLYHDTPCIRDVQMGTGFEPLGAHLGYWENRDVLARSIEILQFNVT